MGKLEVVEYTERWGIGGIERYIANLASALNPDAFHVTVLASQKETDFFDAQLAALGGVASLRSSGLAEDPIRRVLENMRLMADYLRAHPCDVLHLHVCQGVVLRYARIAKACGVRRVIAHCHNAEVGGRLHWLKRIGHLYGRRAYARYLDVRLACSDVAAAWLYPRRDLGTVRICNSLLDVEKFRFSRELRDAMRERCGWKDERVYLTVGRLQEQKNPLFLLEVFDRLARLDPSCRLVWIGDGELRERVHRRAEELGLKERIRFIDSTPDVADYMRAADAFLLPSLHEGNPIVAAEAQAAGLRCYLSDAITRQAGLLKETRFLSLREPPEVWAERIHGDAPLQNRERCADLVRGKGYDIAAQIREMERIYAEG